MHGSQYKLAGRLLLENSTIRQRSSWHSGSVTTPPDAALVLIHAHSDLLDTALAIFVESPAVSFEDAYLSAFATH